MALMFSFLRKKLPITLYDSRRRSLVSFERSGATVTMYHCGPTVYDNVHIGNLRTFLFNDLLRRSFELAGYGVKQVVNITDIGELTASGEDKMTKGLERLGKPKTLEGMREVADIYTAAFLADLKALNIKLPHVMPRASGHIKEDFELIKLLERKGLAYRAEDGIYFDTLKFPEYGAFGQGSASELHARIQTESSKHDPRDFALWKFDAEIGFESPWGKGFPGWHIECSAMSRKYLGQPLDIHTGGADLAPIHHTNEIAQSEGAYGSALARYWMHGAFLTIKGGDKMAKSEGNHLTLQSIVDRGIDPLAFRLWALGGHYRTPMDFSFEALEAAQNALANLRESFLELPKGGKADSAMLADYTAALLADFNAPNALSVFWSTLKSTLPAPTKRATLLAMDDVLGLGLASLKKTLVPAEVEHLVAARKAARDAKDWVKADELRKAIEAKGFMVKDTTSGQSLSPLR
jgi:cysteinyl-tRNA synthetase